MRGRVLFLAFGLLFLIAVVLTACGGGSSGNAQLRVLQASQTEPAIDVLINGTSVATSIGYGSATGYLTVSSNATLTIEPTGTSTASAFYNQVPGLAGGSANTWILCGPNPSLPTCGGTAPQLLHFTNNNTALSQNQIQIRAINMAPAFGSALDVYIVPAGTNINGLISPTTSSLGLTTASPYQTPTPGSYEVFFTAPGQKFALIDTGPITINQGQIRTVVAMNGTFATLSDLN
jgi:Domain of unknown function (DUF4397)